MQSLRVAQPSLTVRLHPDSPLQLVDLSTQLIAAGIGQPGMINDQAAIPALMALDIPIERARDYAIVGCYEAATPGDSYPRTVSGMVPDLALLLVSYLRTSAAENATTFSQFIDNYLAHISSAYHEAVANDFQNAWDYTRDHSPSPFGSTLMQHCVDRALPLEAGGTQFNLFGINMLGLGTTIDSLHAIDNVVFQSPQLSIAQLASAVDADLPDESLRTQLLTIPGRYGTDTEATNQLAADLSQRIARMVLDSRMAHGVRPYPAFFRFTADITQHAFATPDGRRSTDTLSYGCGPSSISGGTPTSILSSTANIAHHLCACGNPLAVSLSPENVQTPDGLTQLKALILSYFAMGGFHVHFNLHSADDLRRAQANPRQYQDMLIRMSGFSAKFITLSENVQAALIERAESTV